MEFLWFAYLIGILHDRVAELGASWPVRWWLRLVTIPRVANKVLTWWAGLERNPR